MGRAVCGFHRLASRLRTLRRYGPWQETAFPYAVLTAYATCSTTLLSPSLQVDFRGTVVDVGARRRNRFKLY